MSSRHDHIVLDLEPSPVLSFKVYGEPIPQGSKAIVPGKKRKDGARAARLVESADKATKNKPANRLANWRGLVHTAGRKAMRDQGLELLDGDLIVGFLFVLPRPTSHFTAGSRRKHPRDPDMWQRTKSSPDFPGTKPDLSKLIRAVEDGLEKAVFVNDSRIIGYRDPFKVYDDREAAGVSIEVWRKA